MNYPSYVVFGEALTDFILQEDGRWLDCPGGSCWNVARVGARLGAPTAFAGAVSQDRFGEELWQLAQEAGLDMRYTQRWPFPPLLAMVPSTQPPEYFFIGDNSADLHFDPESLPAGWMAHTRIAHFGCISLARQPLAARLLRLAQQLSAVGVKIAFDPNFRRPMSAPEYRATFEAMAALADYVKVSEEDLAGLFPSLNLADALHGLSELAPQAEILLTRGADGMCLLKDDKFFHQPVFKVKVADTVGCGDTAMGAWMAHRLQHPHAGPAETLRFIAAAAACTARRHGAYAPEHCEVDFS